MGMYLSFDASVKISKNGDWHSTKADKTGAKRSGKNGIAGIAHYLARAEDLQDGLPVNLDDERHEALDLSRTEDNETYVLRDGQLVPCEHSSEIEDAIRERIEWVDQHSDQPTRENGCVVRGLVVQFGDEDDPALWADAVEYLQGRYGAENILAVSIHRDETSPHMHVLFSPVAEAHAVEWEPVTDKAGNPVYKLDEDGNPELDEDGEPIQKKRQRRGEVKRNEAGEPLYCFDQKAYFPGPSALAKEHRDFRAALIAKGWDVEKENKPIEEQYAVKIDKDGKPHGMGLTPDAVAEIKKIRKTGKSQERQQQGLNARAAALAKERRELDEDKAAFSQEQEQQRQKLQDEREQQARQLREERQQHEKQLQGEREQQRRELRQEVEAELQTERRQLQREREQLQTDREQLDRDRAAVRQREATADAERAKAIKAQGDAAKALKTAQEAVEKLTPIQKRLTEQERRDLEKVAAAVNQAGNVRGGSYKAPSFERW